MPKNAATVAQKWARNLSSATQAITDGVNSVTVNPADKAIAAIPNMVAGVQRAADSGKIAAGLQTVTLASWKQAMLQKGVPRVATGAQQAQPKMEQFMNKLLPYVQSGQQMLQNTPRGNSAQNDQRMLAWAQYMRQFKAK